jgi:leader peptidase (prepilin peptidase)/N-methyltransferase
VTPVLGAGALLAGLVGALGLAIGSFLNVVVHRVPAGMSVVRPASACPRCGTAIRRRDNVPVVSWLVLRGRCRDCAEPISVRYPLVEAATAVLFVVVALRFLPPATADRSHTAAAFVVLVALLYVMAVSVALTLIDLEEHRLPDRIVLPTYPVLAVLLTVASALSGDWGALLRGVVGAAAMGSGYLVLALISPQGMGLGDVKLSVALGFALAYLGWGPLAVGAFAAFALGGTFGIGLVVVRRAGRKTGIPFGPWMVAGAWAGAFCGTALWDSYLGFIGLA